MRYKETLKVPIKTRQLSSGIGVEVLDLDLRSNIDEATFKDIRKAWTDNVILLFRNQTLNNEQHVAFSRRFGTLDNHDAIARLRDPDAHEILPVLNIPGENRLRVGAQWHSDLSHSVNPPQASLLRCEEIPPIGGDTMFSNMFLAYDELSDTMKKVVDPLWCIHDLTIARHNVGKYEEVRKRQPPVAQPLVRVHPENGRKALYVSEFASASIVGMTLEESRPLLDFLFRHTSRPEFTYRHRWAPGDLIIWDNRSATHLALDDYDFGYARRLYRTTVLGEVSGRLAQPAEIVT
ncbi:TauD/TfdA family dioxygenase [Ramlibacter henchirensis]|uniref:TauD/TfdA family dioxygenase n=1 Tax=Ramlibacter henchirensis TaxID=204072 RepID=A0A4Z0BUD8_9BURK|nr:TauD/TfdA family dioxygenase [Ramlibacter henchirensis]TFZ02916.1 TauD/TfdA family dioxygenase [Ramlibacter henchirensis]